VDYSTAHTEYSSASSTGWPGWLVERTGTTLRLLTDRGRPNSVAIHAAVRDLASLPGITDARLVQSHTAGAGAEGPDLTQLPVGTEHVLRLTGPAAALPEVVQTARLVASAIEGRLAQADDDRARLAPVRNTVDRTDLREAQDLLRIESARLRTLVNSIHLAILVVDEQLRIAEVNTAALAMMQLTDATRAVLGVRLADLAHQVDPAARDVVEIAIDFAKRSIGDGKAVHREEIRLPDGTMVEASYLPIDLDGRVRGHLLMVQGVTGRAAAQQALEVCNQELAELRTLKNEFLATVSHELRTPLTAASSLIEALTHAPPDGPMHTEIVDALRRNTDRLMVIVEYLLVLARLESNRIPLAARPVHTRALVADRVERLRSDGSGRPDVAVTENLDDTPDSIVVGDPDWLARMVHYVISGAVATSGHDAQIFVHSEVRGELWTLTVAGTDLPIRDSGHVFSAVVRGGDAPHDADDSIGASLSMLLAQAIANRHGGELTVQQGADGAWITVSLPLG
jgi:signal transduction histidine kinase